MDEGLREDPGQRLTADEVDEVILRFREDEEMRQQELEGRATSPTVKDLAEGLNVLPERIEGILAQIRKERAPALRQDQGMEQVRSKNRNVYAIAIAAFVLLMVLGVFAALLFSSAAPPTQAPQPVESTGTIPGEMVDPVGETLEPAID
ncbi:MAG: hypothetical protein IH944_10730 [Armatimonadetes bacterium]|nr:hypothetical protein [Armatimonadota bacterium]